VWALVDLAVTGNPLFSLLYTDGSAAELQRERPLSSLPWLMVRLLAEIAKWPVLLAALSAWASRSRCADGRSGSPPALVLVTCPTYLVIATGGLPTVYRYLIPAALGLIVFAAFALAGWTTLPAGAPWRRAWGAGAAAVLVLGAGWTLTHTSPAKARAELRERERIRADLRALLADPAVRRGAACGPITVPNHKLVPDVRWLAGAPADGVRARSDRSRPPAEEGVAVVIDRRLERRRRSTSTRSRATATGSTSRPRAGGSSPATAPSPPTPPARASRPPAAGTVRREAARLMCGIAGLLRLDGTAPDPAVLGAMAAALAHRGPDGEGAHLDGPVALASRRLALVDVPGGDQPLRSEDGTIVAVCNGEIYNWRELREELHHGGHAFATRSDCEVLVHLYEEHGPRLVTRLRGMWALALWDARRGRLVLARDPFGIKPLVYARDGAELGFASELKGLLAGGLARDLDPGALGELLTSNAISAPRTIFAGARKLEPGCVLVAEARSGAVRVERVERPAPAPAGAVRSGALRALAGELRERLADSVAAHLRADVPVGVLLSGGLDSGLVAALAARHAGPGLPAFTVGFGERSFDELAPARRVAHGLGLEHHEVHVGARDAVAHLRDVAETFDEPRGDATALPYWLAARAAGSRVKAVLSGEGADELLGGYQTYVADLLPGRGRRGAAALEPVLGRIPSSSRRLSLDFRLRRLALGAGLPALERHHSWKEILTADARAEVLAAAHSRAATRSPPTGAGGPRPPALRCSARLQDVDVGTFLADDLLAQADRAAMAHGSRSACPYLDREVAALALALPTRRRSAACGRRPSCARRPAGSCRGRSPRGPSAASSPRPPRGCAGPWSPGRASCCPRTACVRRGCCARSPSACSWTATPPAARTSRGRSGRSWR
jgi:asparagine synthase (glutamine-hydrolysing)